MSDKSEMVYKVAEAIRKELATMKADIVIEMAKSGPSVNVPFNLLAISAIKAMRNPTNEMLQAAGLSPQIEDWKDNLECNWNIMIDEALKGFE